MNTLWDVLPYLRFLRDVELNEVGLDDLQMSLPTLKILWICDSMLLQHNVEKHGIGSIENLSSSELAAGVKVGHRRVNLSFQCKNKNII